MDDVAKDLYLSRYTHSVVLFPEDVVVVVVSPGRGIFRRHSASRLSGNDARKGGTLLFQMVRLGLVHGGGKRPIPGRRSNQVWLLLSAAFLPEEKKGKKKEKRHEKT